MAKQGAKKTKEENKKRLDLLLRIILISNAIYIVARMAIMHSSFTWKHWIGLMLTSAAYFFPYQQLASMAKPVYSDNGELLDGGFDLSTGGVCEYMYDVIYITIFVQLMSIISEKFWWTYLVIPAFAGYKIFGLLRGTFFSGGSEVIPPVCRVKLKMRRPERKGRKWRRRHLGGR
ncbi:unnamed protein product [Urochloa decumbens]|uniref:Transmembrane protein 208 n=1 Tax=Urochloa decumbens TaxID=240449 RepID=A0ABC9CEX0_9POAL